MTPDKPQSSPLPSLTERPAPSGLLPCPFCGSREVDPAGWASHNPETGENREGPACDDCGASAESAAAWNTRTPQPRHDVEGERGGERGSLISDLMEPYADPAIDRLTYLAALEIARLEELSGELWSRLGRIGSVASLNAKVASGPAFDAFMGIRQIASEGCQLASAQQGTAGSEHGEHWDEPEKPLIDWQIVRALITTLRRDESCDGLSDRAADALETIADAYEFSAPPLLHQEEEEAVNNKKIVQPELPCGSPKRSPQTPSPAGGVK